MTKRVRTERVPQNELVDQLAGCLLEAWAKANGVSDSRVQVLTGEGCFAIVIEDAFTQAERLLAEREAVDNPLRRYLNGLMDVIGEEAIPAGGEIAGRRVRSLGTDVNFEQAWVMWFFKLEEAQP